MDVRSRRTTRHNYLSLDDSIAYSHHHACSKFIMTYYPTYDKRSIQAIAEESGISKSKPLRSNSTPSYTTSDKIMHNARMFSHLAIEYSKVGYRNQARVHMACFSLNNLTSILNGINSKHNLTFFVDLGASRVRYYSSTLLATLASLLTLCRLTENEKSDQARRSFIVQEKVKLITRLKYVLSSLYNILVECHICFGRQLIIQTESRDQTSRVASYPITARMNY